jgi:hypothetical protein
MRRIINIIWAFVTGAIVLAVANSSAIANNATNVTSQAAGNISGAN